MKIEKITDNKIRIILNIDELTHHKTKLRKLTESENESALITMILNEAKKQVGFDVENCKILIDAFATTEDYIVFTLTKYKNDISTNTSLKKIKFKKKSICNISPKHAIYKFDSFDEFCNFCTYCNNFNLKNFKDFAKNISLHEYKNVYYLSLFSINKSFSKSDLFYASISEFATFITDSVIFRGKLREYGTPIFNSQAIDKGIHFFVATKL